MSRLFRLAMCAAAIPLMLGAAAAEDPAPGSPVWELKEDFPLLLEVGGVAQGELVRGTEVQILEEAEGWVRISVTGWIPKAALTSREEPGLAPDTFDGSDFRFRNVTFREGYGLTRALGEVQNKTDAAYSFAMFTLTVYDDSGAIAAVSHFMVSDLAPSETKTFEALITDPLPDRFQYKIQFDTGF